jgi:hypothetical protein
MVNILIMPFHVPFFVVLLYIMRHIELRGLYLKINVILVLKQHAMKIHTSYETQWPDFYKVRSFLEQKSPINRVSFSAALLSYSLAWYSIE